MSITLRSIAVAALGLTALACSGRSAAKTFEYSWAAARFVTCEGVGAAGSFRVHVSGEATTKADGAKVLGSLAVYTSAAAYTRNPGSTSAVAIVKAGGSERKKVSLETPKPPALIPQPKTDETRAVFLPASTTITIPAGGELLVSVSAAVKTDGGSCALGTSAATVPLP